MRSKNWPRRYLPAGLRRLSASVCVFVLALACSSDPVSFDNDSLSGVLSVTNVRKASVPTADGRISGLIVSSTVINAGFITIDVPFLMRWSLLQDGSVFASATQQMSAGLSPGDSRDVTVTLTFDPVDSVSGFRDAVTFDVLSP